jgi:hypothetical protein
MLKSESAEFGINSVLSEVEILDLQLYPWNSPLKIAIPKIVSSS